MPNCGRAAFVEPEARVVGHVDVLSHDLCTSLWLVGVGVHQATGISRAADSMVCQAVWSDND